MLFSAAPKNTGLVLAGDYMINQVGAQDAAASPGPGQYGAAGTKSWIRKSHSAAQLQERRQQQRGGGQQPVRATRDAWLSDTMRNDVLFTPSAREVLPGPGAYTVKDGDVGQPPRRRKGQRSPTPKRRFDEQGRPRRVSWSDGDARCSWMSSSLTAQGLMAPGSPVRSPGPAAYARSPVRIPPPPATPPKTSFGSTRRTAPGERMVLRGDVAFVATQDAPPTPGSYNGIYNKQSPMIKKSFNVRAQPQQQRRARSRSATPRRGQQPRRAQSAPRRQRPASSPAGAGAGGYPQTEPRPRRRAPSPSPAAGGRPRSAAPRRTPGSAGRARPQSAAVRR